MRIHASNPAGSPAQDDEKSKAIPNIIKGPSCINTQITGTDNRILIETDNLRDSMKPVFSLPYRRYITMNKKDIFLIENTENLPLPEGCLSVACICVFCKDASVQRCIARNIPHIHQINESDHFKLIVHPDSLHSALNDIIAYMII